MTQNTKKSPSAEQLIALAELFKAFGDETRVRILFALSESEKGVGEIAGALDMTTSAISHQLGYLKKSKLVKARRDGKAMLYSLADDHVRTVMGQGLEHVLEDDEDKAPLRSLLPKCKMADTCECSGECAYRE